MKRIKLNPYKTNILDTPETPIEITKHDFWNFYLNVLKTKGLDITGTDIDFYIKTIMFEGQDKDMSKTFNYTPQYVHMMRKRLISSGLLLKANRGNYELHTSIKNLKKLLDEGKVDIIEFVFPFKIRNYETQD